MSRVDADYEARKKLYEEIKKFNRTEQEELYRILKRSDEDISENRNGLFFDLAGIKSETIEKITEWIQFCSQNRMTFESREKELQDMREGLNQEVVE